MTDRRPPLRNLFVCNTDSEPWRPARFWFVDNELADIVIKDLRRTFPIDRLELIRSGVNMPLGIKMLRFWKRNLFHSSRR